MNKALQIKLLGDPVLRCVAEEVLDIKDSAIQQLISTMLDTVKVAGGIGIAAPQLGVSKRILIMSSKPNDRYPNAPLMDVTVMINPRIISKSENVNKDWEGCLSVPNLRGLVPRYDSIFIEYYSPDALLHRADFDGFIARVFQHEYDHLDGKIFVDRLESTMDMMIESEWLKFASHSSK